MAPKRTNLKEIFSRGRQSRERSAADGAGRGLRNVKRLNRDDMEITPLKQAQQLAAQQAQLVETQTEYRIPLPVSDTPMIKRNQLMRRENEQRYGNRRSSLTNRGKRASSIGNGFESLPHDLVPVHDLYKHIDSGLPGPHRMRQLLSWCSKRIIDSEKLHRTKKNLQIEDMNAANIAKVIKEELVRDIVDGHINLSWWNQPKGPDTTSTKPLKPNEKNVLNRKLVDELEARLHKLRADIQSWEAVLHHETQLSKISGITSELNVPRHLQSALDSLQQMRLELRHTFDSDLQLTLDEFNQNISILNSISKTTAIFTQLRSRAMSQSVETATAAAKVDDLLKGISRIEGQDPHRDSTSTQG